jgi:cell division protein FtsB
MAKKKAGDGDDEKTSPYRVKAGQSVTIGETDDAGEPTQRTYRAGEQVQLTEKQAREMPWAVDTAERRKRSGQTSRLQKKVEQLEEQIERLKKGPPKIKDDPLRENAIESLRQRGDNFSARGEPQYGSVPADAIDAYERGQIREEYGIEDAESDDEAAGMHGIGRARASDEHVGPVDSDPPESIPSQGGPGSGNLQDAKRPDGPKEPKGAS